MRQVFKSLDQGSEFPDRVAASFPGVYLTLISVIQGGALVLLLANTLGYVKDANLSAHWGQFLPYSLMSLAIVVLVTYEYTWFVAVYRWSPGILDVTIPFTLGILEGIPLFYFTEPRIWWLLQIVFCIGGVAAFSHTLANTRKRKGAIFGTNEPAYVRTEASLRRNIVISFVAAAICVMAVLISLIGILDGWPLTIALGIPYFLCAVGMVWSDEKFVKALHHDFGFDR